MKSTSLLLPLISPVLASPSLLTPRLLTRQDTGLYNASLNNVTIFGTGGTIASTGSSSTETVGGLGGGYSVGLGVGEILEAVPELTDYANIVDVIQVTNEPSGSINSSHLLNLTRLITAELAKPEISGVVITHGTDTLEETCFWLDLTVETDKPIVCTAAMRPATAISADGPLNLLQSVILAASPNAVGRGAMMSLNDRIGSAFYMMKTHANSLDTFHNFEAGALGYYINQVPYFYYQPTVPIGKQYFNVSGLEEVPQVDILYSHQMQNPAFFQFASETGAAGIVYAGNGAGGISRDGRDAAEVLYNATGKSIVASRKVNAGFATTRGFVIGSGFLNPVRARIFLQLGLTRGYDDDAIRGMFGALYPDP
jgi:L-asparaginase